MQPATLLLLVLVGAFLLSLQPRIRQYREWIHRPSEFFSRGVVVSSTDSYRWFRLADEHRSGRVDFSRRDPLRAYPEGVAYGEVPLLSRLIACLSRGLGVSVYQAGMLLMIPLSSLFVIPLGYYFFRLGYPLAGIWGGLTASFSSAYVVRTFVHRVDTDGGNMFFMWLVSLCIACISTGSSLRFNWAMAAATGISIHAFSAWYSQPGFALAFSVCLLAHLAASRFGARSIALLVATCVVFANPLDLVRGAADIGDFTREYVLGLGAAAPGTVRDGLTFPSLLGEISELQRASPGEALSTLLDPPGLAAFGLLAFFFFAIRHWRGVIPLLPLLALGVLGVVRSTRFLMYLAPFVGVGYGYAVTQLIRVAMRAAAARSSGGILAAGSAGGWLGALLYALGLFALAPMLPHTAYHQEPRPRISVDLIASLQELKERLPAPAAIAHTWGHGYLVTAVTGGATFNDGELLDPVVEQLLDRGIASDDQRELYSILTFLAARGRAGVDRVLSDVHSYPELLERIAADSAVAPDPLYLLLTDKMAREFSHYFRKGHWDFANGRGPREGYDFRSCRPLPDDRLRCEKPARRPLIVDPEEGTINGAQAVKKLVRVRDGSLFQEVDYPVEAGLYLQLMEAGGGEPWELHILKRVVYETNFNQMFALGRYDPALFRRIHDDPPVARAYELIRQTPSVR